jgi:hypothetical protein
VTPLRVEGRVACDVYLFDPHRLALPVWAACVRGPGALLLSLDRHFDLVKPAGSVPRRGDPLENFDQFTRWQADVRNVDQILTALEGDLFTTALVAARTRLPEGATGDRRVLAAATLRSLLASDQARYLLAAAPEIVLDIDLDCFTSLNDADPTAVLTWPEDQIAEFLLPDDAIWKQIWPRLSGVTVAREPLHCGGVVEGNRLFERFARVFFQRMLGADLP